MFYYQAYTKTIQADIVLSLPTLPQQLPDYILRLEEPGALDEAPIRWIHDYQRENSFLGHRLGILGSDYLVRFDHLADFLIKGNSNQLHCFPARTTDTRTLEHLLLDQVVPRLLNQKGFLVLHAGGILTPKGVVGFAGKSGSGKSTITASFGKQRYPILTDDCLVIELKKNRILALPSYPAIRVNKDTAASIIEDINLLNKVAEYSSKLLLEPDQGNYISHNKPSMLQALLVLEEYTPGPTTQKISVEKCLMRDAFGLLIGNIFRLDPTDKQNNMEEFKKLNDFVVRLPVYRLKYSPKDSLVEDVIQTTLKLLEEM